MSWKEYDGIEKGKDKNKGNNGKGDEKKNENANNNNGKGKGKANCNDSAGNPGKGNGPLNNPGKGKKIGLYKQFGENGKDHVYHKETTYLYEGMSNTLHKEYSETGSPYAEYYNGPNGQLTSRKMFGLHGLSNPSHDPNLKTTGGLLYYQYDGQRNVSEVTDRHGDLIERYRYDAFGGIFTGTTSPYNHHGYTGMRYDGKTGLVDLNARWYNPTAGKFMNEDTYPGILSQPQTQNRYSYALNNPVNMWDPSGHVAVPVDGGAIPSWVRSQESPTIVEPNGIFTNYHYWDFKNYTQTKSDTRLVNEVMELRGYNQTYQKDVSNTWTYDYLMITTIIVDGLEKKHGDEWNSTETFNESYTEEWFDFISAEEIAGQNAEEIAKYGAPVNAKMLDIKINRPAAFDKYIERELKRFLIQIQPANLAQMNFENGKVDWYYYQTLYNEKGESAVPKSIVKEFTGTVRDDEVSWFIFETVITGGSAGVVKGALLKGIKSGVKGVTTAAKEVTDNSGLFTKLDLQYFANKGSIKPKPGTLNNVDARKWYLEQEAKIPSLLDENATLEQLARQAFDLRNKFRTQARELMSDKNLAASLNKSDPNLTWEQSLKKYSDKGLQGDELWQEIIDASQRSRSSVNKLLDLE